MMADRIQIPVVAGCLRPGEDGPSVDGVLNPITVVVAGIFVRGPTPIVSIGNRQSLEAEQTIIA